MGTSTALMAHRAEEASRGGGAQGFRACLPEGDLAMELVGEGREHGRRGGLAGEQQDAEAPLCCRAGRALLEQLVHLWPGPGDQGLASR